MALFDLGEIFRRQPFDMAYMPRTVSDSSSVSWNGAVTSTVATGAVSCNG
jgi:hypothetical protein